MKVKVKEMANLYQKGLTLEQIGEKFHLTRQAVQQRLQKAGISRRGKCKFDKIDKSELQKLYSDKKTLAEIADHFSVSICVVRKALKMYEIPKRPASGKWVDLFRSMEVGDSQIVESNLQFPHPTLHYLARRKGIKISVNKLGENQLRITRQC